MAVCEVHMVLLPQVWAGCAVPGGGAAAVLACPGHAPGGGRAAQQGGRAGVPGAGLE